MLYPCACCGYLTRLEADYGTFDICPVCFWQDEYVDDPDEETGGANPISLNEAKKNFIKYGACDEKYINYVRAPLSEEIPNNN